MRPEFFTDGYGMIVDHLAEWMREMQKRTFGDALNKYFKLGRDLNQRDTIAVKHTVSGLLKRLYPNEEYTKDAVRRSLEYRGRGSVRSIPSPRPPRCERIVENVDPILIVERDGGGGRMIVGETTKS